MYLQYLCLEMYELCTVEGVDDHPYFLTFINMIPINYKIVPVLVCLLFL